MASLAAQALRKKIEMYGLVRCYLYCLQVFGSVEQYSSNPFRHIGFHTELLV